jgi:hypothetical protein
MVYNGVDGVRTKERLAKVSGWYVDESVIEKLL